MATTGTAGAATTTVTVRGRENMPKVLGVVRSEIGLTAVPANVSTQTVAPKVLVHLAGEEVTRLAAVSRGLIDGVSVTNVVSEFLTQISVAAITGEVAPILTCAVFSIGLSYSVASTWADEYPKLPVPHVLQAFEVSGRKTVVTEANKGVKSWIEKQDMNGKAARVFGGLLVACASDSGYLGQTRKKYGTIFSPPADTDESERAKLMRESAKTVTDAEKAMVARLSGAFPNFFIALDEIFGTGAASIDLSLEYAVRATGNFFSTAPLVTKSATTTTKVAPPVAAKPKEVKKEKKPAPPAPEPPATEEETAAPAAEVDE